MRISTKHQQDQLQEWVKYCGWLENDIGMRIYGELATPSDPCVLELCAPVPHNLCGIVDDKQNVGGVSQFGRTYRHVSFVFPVVPIDGKSGDGAAAEQSQKAVAVAVDGLKTALIDAGLYTDDVDAVVWGKWPTIDEDQSGRLVGSASFHTLTAKEYRRLVGCEVSIRIDDDVTKQ